jgi:hypothetical protein
LVVVIFCDARAGSSAVHSTERPGTKLLPPSTGPRAAALSDGHRLVVACGDRERRGVGTLAPAPRTILTVLLSSSIMKLRRSMSAVGRVSRADVASP